jgi:NADPH:quinone reductase-like Zn-dependent oxidoreductase
MRMIKTLCRWTLGVVLAPPFLAGILIFSVTTSPVIPMKALVYCEYGPAEIPQLKDLRVLTDLIPLGKVASVIDRVYKLRGAPAAVRYLEQGQARGKVIISIE